MTNLRRYFTKRWIGFFCLYFFVWYPISVTLTSVYQIMGQGMLILASSLFTIIYWIVISYFYFRKTSNDWTSRLIVGASWIGLMLVCSSALAKPVYGVTWDSIFNLYTYIGAAINFSAILLGAILAPHVGDGVLLARSREALRPSSAPRLPEQDSQLPQ